MDRVCKETDTVPLIRRDIRLSALNWASESLIADHDRKLHIQNFSFQGYVLGNHPQLLPLQLLNSTRFLVYCAFVSVEDRVFFFPFCERSEANKGLNTPSRVIKPLNPVHAPIPHVPAILNAPYLFLFNPPPHATLVLAASPCGRKTTIVKTFFF